MIDQGHLDYGPCLQYELRGGDICKRLRLFTHFAPRHATTQLMRTCVQSPQEASAIKLQTLPIIRITPFLKSRLELAGFEGISCVVLASINDFGIKASEVLSHSRNPRTQQVPPYEITSGHMRGGL